MEFRQLQYFLMLCNELHFSEAAFKLGITQPTLSQQIRVLEDEIGVPLFDRIGKKTVKTEAGEILEHHARQIVQQLENAKTAIADLTRLHASHLRIAVLPSDLDYRLTSLLIDFHNQFPQTKVQVFPSIDIVNQVLNIEVDLGVGLSMPAMPADQRLTRIPFYTETYSLYVHADHPLAGCESVSADDLRTIPFVMYPKGFYGRDLIDRWGSENGLTVETIMETGSATSLLQLVHAGIGATIQPSRLIESFQSLKIRAIEIKDSPIREMVIMYRNDKYMSVAAKAFIHKLETSFRTFR
ncbi:LysR family transcriptional regulator [Brevibacillus parabrevis]|uniref:LysR family transcriptional regulator n=1 Tax=Brevibacillus parabrevis TaxID=54914 RepID=UPI0007AB34FF|nr:LysR family transcriptional regulator [Brevibacillus parabrevis]KZE50445.1 LysR family transcriptional regulator [Brevibacillus parabrevis]